MTLLHLLPHYNTLLSILSIIILFFHFNVQNYYFIHLVHALQTKLSNKEQEVITNTLTQTTALESMKSDMERLQNNNDLLKEENTIQEEAIDEFNTIKLNLETQLQEKTKGIYKKRRERRERASRIWKHL